MNKYDIRHILAFNIKYYRFRLGITQEQLAEKCDISPRYISDIENGKGNIPIDTLSNISSALNVEPYILLKGIKSKNKLPKRVNMKR